MGQVISQLLICVYAATCSEGIYALVHDGLSKGDGASRFGEVDSRRHGRNLMALSKIIAHWIASPRIHKRLGR